MTKKEAEERQKQKGGGDDNFDFVNTVAEKPEDNKAEKNQPKAKCNCEKECDCDGDCVCDGTCECNDKSQQFLEMAQRIQAEFDNYRRRNADVICKARENGTIDAVEKLLPIVDSLESAKKQVQDDNFKKAIDLIYMQVIQAFKNLNVEKIDALNAEFDPKYHNAVLVDNKENVASNIITEELQAGFKIGDKIIRHSAVKVNK